MGVPRPLTRRQGDVLWIVSEHAPVTAAEVARHLLLDTSQAHSTLRALEQRALIDATYTNTRPGYRGRGYVITARGTDVVAAFDPPEDDDDA